MASPSPMIFVAMPIEPSFDLSFIGAGWLLARCVEAAAERGHRIASVLPCDNSTRRWALRAGFRTGASIEALRRTGLRPDFIISINNGHLLSASEIASARRAAINFHNGPLPRYAGVHHVPWAIINHETTFGVTWHLMTTRPDAGAIVFQEHFTIANDETAFSLLTKCGDAGVSTFNHVLDLLDKADSIAQNQDLDARTHYPSSMTIPRAGVIDWSTDDTTSLLTLDRACTFGELDNAFGVPKAFVSGRPYLVTDLGRAGGREELRVGAVRVHAGGVALGLRDGVLIARLIRHVNGDPASLTNRSQAHLQSLPATALNHIARAARSAAALEQRLVSELRDSRPMSRTLPRSTDGDARTFRVSVDWKLAEATAARIGSEPAELMALSLAATRSDRRVRFVSTPSIRSNSSASMGLLARWIPVLGRSDGDDVFGAAAHVHEMVDVGRTIARRRTGLLCDALPRYNLAGRLPVELISVGGSGRARAPTDATPCPHILVRRGHPVEIAGLDPSTRSEDASVDECSARIRAAETTLRALKRRR